MAQGSRYKRIRTEQVAVRLTPGELKDLKEQAEAADLSIGEYVRRALGIAPS